MINTETNSVKNPIMTLITKAQLKKLNEVGHENMKPIVKLFGGPLTWLVTSIDDDVLYGYADLSHGCVEWGSLCHISELSSMRIGFSFLERDRYFTAKPGVNYLKMETLSGI